MEVGMLTRKRIALKPEIHALAIVARGETKLLLP
jgi:hypothetical protein